MPNYAKGVNPDVLKWARIKSGQSIIQIATLLKKDPAIIAAWENGSAIPTYNQLEKLAYSFYKRPVALFFFPSPPEEPELSENFRTLPDFELSNLLPDTRHAIREGHSFQNSLIELTSGKNPTKNRIFDDIKLSPEDSIFQVTNQVRSYLNISLIDQSKFIGTTDALKAWRRAIEEAGIFIFKRSFKQRDISGFCINDDEFPIIYINNSSSKSRQIFTIFHELAHILLESSGITKTNNDYINTLSGRNKRIEVFCNKFSGEFLVPSTDFNQRFDLKKDPLDIVDESSHFYNVSREVILRKLLDKEVISKSFYELNVKEWNEEYLQSRRGSKGGNFYATQAVYLGERYLNLAFSRYYDGKITVGELSEHLNIKAKSIEGIERRMLRSSSRK